MKGLNFGFLLTSSLLPHVTYSHDHWPEDGYPLYQGYCYADSTDTNLVPCNDRFAKHAICTLAGSELMDLVGLTGYPSRFQSRCAGLLAPLYIKGS